MNFECLTNISSSYNLGVAIASFAIIVAFIEIVSLKNDLKIRIYSDYKRIALFFAFLSILLAFISEFLKNSFYTNAVAAFLMIVSISVYIWLVSPIKKVKKSKTEKLKNILDGFLPNKYSHNNSKIVKDIIYVFNSLLELSLKNKNAAELFNRYFTSKVFLEYFSKSGYIFTKTTSFLLQNNSKEVQYFFEQLFLTSLDDQDSYLNIFLREEIYPNTIDSFDMAMLEESEKVQRLLSRIKFDLGYKLNLEGKTSFLKVADRYFKLIGWFNDCNKYPKKQNCKIKYELNDNLVKYFFDSIKEIFGSTYKYTETERKELLNMIYSVRLLHSYNYCIDSNSKSEDIRKTAGGFLYEICEELLIYYDFYNKEKSFENRHIIDSIYDNLTNHGKDKIAQKVFLDKMKEKIINDKYSSNLKGWYPAMILIYWQLFGFSIFTGNTAQNEPRDIHVEILSKLAESFPKLYDGHIRHLYDNELPEGKEEHYIKKGRKILNDFLLEYMEYNREENSLSYYFQFGDSPDAKKIFLSKVKDDQEIEAVDI